MTDQIAWEEQNEARIIEALFAWHLYGRWSAKLGPRPEHEGCQIAAELFEKAGIPAPAHITRRIKGSESARQALAKRQAEAEDLAKAAARRITPAKHQIELQPRHNSDSVSSVIARLERREAGSAAEAQRIAAAQLELARKLRAEKIVLREGNRSTLVSKKLTRIDRLIESGRIPRQLGASVRAFALLVAQALGLATDDGDDSTNGIIGGYGDPARADTNSDRALAALEILRNIHRGIPREQMELFVELAGEEVGSLVGKPRTLQQIGEQRGYAHKQASAAGSEQLYCVVTLINHLLKIQNVRISLNPKGVPDLRNSAGFEQNDTICDGMSHQGQKLLTSKQILETVAA